MTTTSATTTFHENGHNITSYSDLLVLCVGFGVVVVLDCGKKRVSHTQPSKAEAAVPR